MHPDVKKIDFVRPDFIVTPDTGEEDRIMAFITPNMTILYREEEGGNIYPTQDILNKLEEMEGLSYTRMGEIQIFSGGVPEILISGDSAERDEDVVYLAGILKERGIVPDGTPLFAVRDGRVVEIREAPALTF